MADSPFRSILEILQYYIRLTPDASVPSAANQLLFDPRLPASTLPTPDLSTQLSTLGLPAPLYHELSEILTKDFNEDRSFIEQTQARLLQQLSTLSTSSNPSVVPSLVQTAFKAFHGRLIDARIDSLRCEIAEFGLPGDSATESDGSSESDLESEGNDDVEEYEYDQNVAEEDDNAPVRPGEDIPPLETRYLPIFEALHERGKVLTKPEKTYLVNMTGMTYRQITIWFQNRRRGELKEDSNQRPVSPLSDQTSDASDDEPEVERQLAHPHSDTTFNIRSWCLASAAAANVDANPALLPPSPVKSSFSAAERMSSFDSDSDLTDSDDEDDLPPGLKVPSLSLSLTTVDSSSDRGPSTIVSRESSRVAPASFKTSAAVLEPEGTELSRPIKPLPSAKRASSFAAPLQERAATFGTNPDTMVRPPFQPLSFSEVGLATSQSSQPITSDERGLHFEMVTTPPASILTLRFSAEPPSLLSSPNPISPARQLSSSPSPPADTTVSRRGTPPSPPSEKSSPSPRPTIKPLPRRTGCAPRPRPPPRATLASTPIPNPTSNPSSARPSVVLPPASNPSLASTTLGALLKPNPLAPAIPSEMEERLSAMAGRMGVGAGPTPVGRGPVGDTTSKQAGIASGVPRFPQRGASFTFGSSTLVTSAEWGSGFPTAPQPGQTEGQSIATRSL